MNALTLLAVCCTCILLCTTITTSTFFVSAQSGPGPFIYDVTQYGAVGDGKTDCTAAVQRAVNALMTTVPNPIYNAPFTSTIWFPAGIFLLSASLPRSTPAYISLASGAWVETFIITGAMPNTTSTYATPLTTIIWNSAEGELINYNGLPPSPIQNNNGGGYLTVANLTIVTPQNIAGWRSMVEFDGVSTFTAVNIIFNGNSISPQMVLFNALSASAITFQSITALDVNFFFELIEGANSLSITMNNVTVTNENYQVAFQPGSSSILLQGGYTSLTIQNSTFNSTNLFLQSSSDDAPNVMIENCFWYDSNQAITVADSSSIYIVNSEFIIDAQLEDMSSISGTAVTTISSESPSVTITDSYFTATSGQIGTYYTGVRQQGVGQVILSNNAFTNLSVGFNYTSPPPNPNNPIASASHPFRLINNLFSGVGQPAVGTANGIVVNGNECQQSGYMAITCTQICSLIENSPECFQTPSSAASHPHPRHSNNSNKKASNRHIQLHD